MKTKAETLNLNSSHKVLLKTLREGFLDCSFYGSVFLAKNGKIVSSFGAEENEICFLRSLAKPLQASIIADTNLIADLKLTLEELAICQGSHSGSPRHITLLKKLAKKMGVKVTELEIMPQPPLDLRGFNGVKTKFHNNCSAKHLLMVIASKYLGFDSQGYTKPTHKIQKLIKNKQDELSEYKSEILTYDGCSTPLWGLPYKNLIIAFNNYFKDEKNQVLIKSVLKNPYIFGGFNRFDTEIIQKSKGKLYSKVGAGGFVLVYNFEKDTILVVKMAQDNNEIRRLVTLNYLNKLNWLEFSAPEFILNQKGQPVSKYCYEHALNL